MGLRHCILQIISASIHARVDAGLTISLSEDVKILVKVKRGENDLFELHKQILDSAHRQKVLIIGKVQFVNLHQELGAKHLNNYLIFTLKIADKRMTHSMQI